MRRTLILLAAPLIAACGGPKYADGQGEMSFFVTSMRAADSGNFGGLAGADAHCVKLAQAAGSTEREWRAYLSADATETAHAVNARDRSSLVSGHFHDMITGSKSDGTLEEGATCSAWTSDGPFTVVGHHNRSGTVKSWNAAHVTDNCKLEGFQRSSGDARFYCFALD